MPINTASDSITAANDNQIPIWNRYTKPFYLGWGLLGATSFIAGAALNSWRYTAGSAIATSFGYTAYSLLIERRHSQAARANTARLNDDLPHLASLQRRAAKGAGWRACGIAAITSGLVIFAHDRVNTSIRDLWSVAGAAYSTFNSPPNPVTRPVWRVDPDLVNRYMLGR